MVRREPELVVAPSWAEMDRCIEVATGWLGKLMVVLRYTGLRVGEAMLLRWTDLDLDRATLAIRKEISKNRKGRVIPISPHLVEELAGWGMREGWVIPSTRREGEREHQARQRDASRAWDRAGVRADIWGREPFHAFRNSFTTNMLALGTHPDAVDHLQGHKPGRGSRDRYIDVWRALPLEETAAQVPAIGEVKDKVVGMLRRGGEVTCEARSALPASPARGIFVEARSSPWQASRQRTRMTGWTASGRTRKPRTSGTGRIGHPATLWMTSGARRGMRRGGRGGSPK